MTTQSAQSTYEKLTTAALFLLVAAAGWGPFIARAGHASYIERGFLFVTLAIGFLSLALIYDAAERFLARGRGVYFAAIFCSLPATGLLVTDPGLLSVAMLLLLVSAATWFAARAEGEQRTFLLAMLAGLLLIAGCGFFIFPGALAFLFPVWLAAYRSSRRTLVATILLASYGIGMFLRQFSGFNLPILDLPSTSVDALSVIALMPWRLYAVLVLLFLLFTPRAVKSWQIGAFATLLLTSAVAGAAGANLTVISALLAPGLALLAGDLALESFEPDLAKPRKWLFALPPLLTAVLIIVTIGLGVSESVAVPAPDNVRIATGAVLAVLLIFTTLRRLPRWSFALLFAAGVWFGSFLWPYAEFLPAGSEPISTQIRWILLPVAIFASGIAYYLYYGRGIPKRALTDGSFRFGGEDFRHFHDTTIWEGKAAPVVDAATELFSFVIFGDVTGSESPVAGRHGGYFAFRSLTERMKQDTPRFAISLGDLATQATALSFRRLRQLLRFVPVPMTAIPGNHDLFRGTHYDARYFQSLFGADHRTFRLGPAQFVLINNAWGSFEERQFAWLEETLRASDAPFLLVFCHKPIFDLRPGGSYAMEMRDHAERLHDLFCAHDVTAVFSGHIHALLSQIRDGVTYVISGGGGSRLASSEDVHHYLSVNVGAETLAVRALPVERISPAVPLLELHFSPRPCSFSAAAISPSHSAS